MTFGCFLPEAKSGKNEYMYCKIYVSALCPYEAFSYMGRLKDCVDLRCSASSSPTGSFADLCFGNPPPSAPLYDARPAGKYVFNQRFARGTVMVSTTWWFWLNVLR